MADYKTTYQRNRSVSREDPRLTRREAKSPTKNKSPTTQTLQDTTWQNSQYTRAPLQTSYQHLQPAISYDPNQYSTQGYQNAYAGYQAYGNSAYTYEGYGQSQANYVAAASGTIQPGPPGEEYPQAAWAPVAGYVNNQAPAAPLETKSSQQSVSTTVKVDAVAQEMKHQKAELTKQREEYERRITVLRRELELLRRQKQDLKQEHASDRDTEHILRENGKLQVEIQNKLKDAYNVIEILTSIIGDGSKLFKEDESPKKERTNSSTRRSISIDSNENKYNYVHYDPELHWCRMCDVFPKTAKDLLMHLHSKEHRDMMQEENVEIPWHKLPPEPEFPFVEGASKKRLPIKGLQFFVSSTAWYCRLCDSWIGDLHCASQHLKSMKHSQNYSNFVEQNPHWEIEWLKDRERALERIKRNNRSSDSDDHDKKKKKQRKDKYSPSSSNGKDKKRKKRSKKRSRKDSTDSSSSSSSSASSSDEDKKDTSKSIHVAMRNKMKLQAQMLINEELGGKWEAIGRLVEEHKLKDSSQAKEIAKAAEPEDSLINQWMSVKQPQDKDKVLLDSLKDRLKQKQAEKIKLAEMERKRREKEKEEQELREKEEARLALEKEKARQKQREDMERLKEIREQVKFKPKEKNKRRKSQSHSPENTHKKSKSPSTERRKPTPEKYRRHENGQYSSEKSHEDSPNRKYKRKHESREESSRSDKKPPPPPSYKKLPFIGRMPLFKNKKSEDKVEKEIKKEDYDIPRQTRFQPGNLARAFIPEPEVCCFPKLSCYPPLTTPIPPAPIINKKPPAPPKISESVPKAPPPPKINEEEARAKIAKAETEIEREERDESKDIEEFLSRQNQDEDPLNDYHEPFGFSSYSYGNVDYNMMYPPHPPMFDYVPDVDNGGDASNSVPLSHTMPLQPPPLPPDDPNDDLALLGISSDDLAAQLFK